MSIKLKALGLGLLAAMAMGSFAVVNASATVSGHFTSDIEHTILVGTENLHTSHFLEFENEGGSTPIVCTEASYSGTIGPKTVQSVQVFPTYSKCETKGAGNPGSVVVHMNGCSYTFGSNSTGHGTATVDCPVGQTIVITHPNCTIRIPGQAPSATRLTGGLTYTTTLETKHALTVDVTVSKITGHYEGGICIFLGTSQNFRMNGSVTVRGTDTAGVPVNITQT